MAHTPGYLVAVPRFALTPLALCTTLLLALTACKDDESTPAADEEEVPADPAPPPEANAEAEPAEPPEPEITTGFAVIRGGAPIYLKADRDGDSVPLERSATEPAPTDRPWGMVGYVLGEQDGLLQVDLMGSSTVEHHCADQPEPLQDFRLRVYVEAGDLLPVTTREVSHEFSDGTSVKLAPGVPLRAHGEEHIASARNLGLELVVPPDAIDDYYEPGQAFENDEPKGKVFSDGTLRYAGDRSLQESELFKDGVAVAHFAETSLGDGPGVTVRTPCAEVVARAHRALLDGPAPEGSGATPGESAGVLGKLQQEGGHFLASPYGAAYAVGNDDEDVWGGLTGSEVGEAYGVGGLGLVGTGRRVIGTTFEIARGAAVYWEDGTSSGVVLAKHEFSEKPTDRDGRKCFATGIYPDGPKDLVLCFDAGDVTDNEPEGTIGLGNVGLIGKGGGGGTGSGYGRGAGAGFGGRGKRVPRVRQAKATVKGALDRDIIRRIVRAHINEVRSCYNAGLTKDPKLEGRVAIDFTIGTTGKVGKSEVDTTTVSDKSVGKCIAKAVKRWKFPRPRGGGVVTVTYPFVLSPG